MSTLPNGWVETPLGRVVKPRGLKAKPQDVAELPFIGLEHVEAHSSKILSLGRTSDMTSAVVLFKAGDVLYGRLRPYLNKVVQPNFDGTASAEFIVIPGNIAIDTAFLKQRLMASDFVSFASHINQGDRPRVDFDQIGTFPLALPPFNEQRHIVAKLDSLLARSRQARKELARVPRLVERYKQAVLECALNGEWLPSPQRNNWKSVSVADLSAAMFDGPFGSNLKSSDYVANGKRVVRLENIGRLHFAMNKETYISEEKFTSLKRHLLLQNDVLISSFIDDSVRVCLLPGALSGMAINKADCFCIRVDTKVCLPEFFAYKMSSDSTYHSLAQSVHGATRPRINLRALKELLLLLPPLNEQRIIIKQISEKFSAIDKTANEASRSYGLLEHLDQAILAKAFRGELVPQDPNDEPASVLLERLKASSSEVPKPKRGRRPKKATEDA